MSHSYWSFKLCMGQLCIGETTIVLLCKEGIWIRFGWWKQQGYWLTWSIQKRFSERIGYDKPIWQIGKGKRFRIAVFFMETPSHYYEEKERKQHLRRVK